MQDKYHTANVVRQVAPFMVDGLAIPYPEFVPKLYNFCIELGFQKRFIMPSRAFCSDENQGLPIILLTKHFGTFPFNHGRVGGMLAVDRHGPHSHHGNDLVIVQASHVGYDPDTGQYGMYRRPQLSGDNCSVSCGKLTHVITPYVEQYQFARKRIFLSRDSVGRCLITAKNSFIDFDCRQVEKGLVLKLANIVEADSHGKIKPVAVGSTTQTYEVSAEFKKWVEKQGHEWKSGQGDTIGDLLTDALFFFREDFHETDDTLFLERSLMEFMPDIVSARFPPLRAAKTSVQLEFTRVVESIRRGDEYANRNLVYIAGLNIDISERNELPATNYFVPWAAHVPLTDQMPSEYIHPIEQENLHKKLMAQSVINKDQIDLKENIKRLLKSPSFDIRSRQK